MIFLSRSSRSRDTHSPGFTLLEVLIAAGLSGIILAGVLTANLQIIRNGVRLAHYAEMESQVRRAFVFLGRDLKHAVDITWNGENDITLTIPVSATAMTKVTYAWTAASGTFYRVAGASSAETIGRLELVRGIPAQFGGRAGLVFTRFDRTGAAATTDDATRIITVTLTVVRGANTLARTTQNGVSATFALRNKSSF